MQKKKKNRGVNPEAVLLTIIYIILSVIVIAAIVTEIVACVKYGNKPITEIPAWALMFILGGRGK